MEKETKAQSESAKGSIEGLPFEDSPYVQYKDLEDYKRQGYGTEGHQEPKAGRGAGATEAPTLSGAAVSSQAQAQAKDKAQPTGTDVINRQGVP
ncbi:uncharacterized protein LOC130715814 [Lotus japonicus]|uniref:uncharacterized protein LOC130715814 n=1 Tax=Lotus japonicus TaxID=34305 RepID=UPI002588247F|nr:uncharacterized protein LOC130715814 [Lotus japonicus]